MRNAKRYSAPGIIALLLLLGAMHTAHAQCSVAYTFTGEAASDLFGSSVSAAGDVDGDSYDDVIVGAWGNDAGGTSAGRAYVYSGANGSLLYTFTGEGAADYLGISVSGAGDVSGDGFADVIVGASGFDASGGDEGRAYVYSGQDGTLLHTFTGEAAFNNFGFSVSGAGDVDGDGLADMIVGAHGAGTTGRAYVYSGQDGALLYTFTGEASGDDFGFSASGARDVNNDGFADVVVGARTSDAGGHWAGRAYVYSGKDGSLLYTFTGEAADDLFGNSVSDAGDVNGDGFADVIVGAVWNDAIGSDAGRAYVYSGQNGSLLYTFTGEAADNFFGISVSAAGDVNGDAFDDLIVGAWHNDAGGTSAGRAYVYSGQSGSLLYTFTGDASGDTFGRSVSAAGDVNNDGHDDVIVGAQHDDASADGAGRAYVFTCLPPAIPTLTEWGMIALGLLLFGCLGWYARRRRTAVTTNA